MPTTLPLLEDPGDAELIAAVRGGDGAAYGTLYERHVDAARRLARQLVTPSDADDLVAEAFAKVLTVLQRGGGPDVAFRAYLLTAVRRLHVDRIRATSRVRPTDDLTPFDPGVPFRDTAVEGFESQAAARAFASLPERWQAVLWHTEVEGQKPAEIAPLLGMTPNSVAALAYRAREGLRQAFLTQHAAELEDDACRWTHSQLGGYVRHALSRRDVAKVEHHLEGCRPCTGVYLELVEVNSELRAILAPLLLGAVAGTAYLGTTGALGALSAPGWLGVTVDRVRDLVLGNTPAAAAASVAGIAAVTVVTGALVLGGADPRPPGSEAPRAALSAPTGTTGPLTGAGDRPTGTGTPDSTGPTPTTPTGVPTVVTTFPTAVPTTFPTSAPTSDPTTGPTQPTQTAEPTQPTEEPTTSPTWGPTATAEPTDPVTSQPPTSDPTSAEPTTPEPTPALPVADLSVRVDRLSSLGVEAHVLGIPDGLPATLRISGTGVSVLITSDTRCSPAQAAVVCQLTGPGSVRLTLLGVDSQIRFEVTSDAVTDPDATNNTTTLALGAVR